MRSKERNVNLGQRDTSRTWDPYVTITLADNSVYPQRGLVDFAEPQVDPQTGTFSVRAEMPNPGQILLPGQFTKVRLLLDVREDAIAVPSKAIVIEKGGAYIFVVRKDNTVEKDVYKRQVWIPQASVEDTIREYGYKGKVTVVENGNDFSGKESPGLLREQARKDMGIADDELVFLFVGQHIWEKGVGLIIDALACLLYTSRCV